MQLKEPEQEWDGVKGICQPLVIEIIAKEMKTNRENINKKGDGKILLHPTKGENHE